MIRKVLMITYYFPPVVYGSSIRALNFAKHLTDYNWASSILTLNYPMFPALKDFTVAESLRGKNVKVYAVNLGKFFSEIALINFPSTKTKFFPKILSKFAKIFAFSEPESVWKFRAFKLGEKILKSDRFNAIIAFAPPLSTIQVGLGLSKKFKIPLLIDYFSIPTQKKFFAPKDRKLLFSGSSVIVDNRKIKDYLLKTYPFLNYNYVKIIPTGVDYSEFENLYTSSEDKFTLTLVHGKISTKKFKLFLNALAYLCKKEPNLKKSLLLNLIGIPTSEIYNLIAKLHIKENLRIYQNLKRKDYIEILMSSDFLIYFEDFDISNVPYDYVATRKPYIAIMDSSNNYRYIIGDYKNSLVANINEPSSVIDALARAFELFLNKKTPSPNLNPENYDIKKIIINLVRELEMFTPD